MKGEDKKRITAFVNGKRVGGKAIYVPKKWNDFLKIVGKKVGINAVRVFNEDGGEIDDVDLISNRDVMYISSGEAFVPPTVDNHGKENEWVTLNVGGRIFSTTRSTLTKDRDSMLASMFGDSWNSATDASGSYMIDRTPEYFAPILNYLRCGVLVIDDGVNAEGVLNEAKFFNIAGIIDKLTAVVERKNRADAFSRKDVISILLTSSTNSTLRCQGLNLSGVDLSRLDLSHINFKMTNFQNANLSYSNLDNTLLQDAELQGADLSFANLRGANLNGANLEGTNLKGANFEDRGGVRANLEGTNLKAAWLEEVNFSGSNLRVANLKGANLENCNLRGADLAGANLEDANLRGANLHKANLIGANLRGANFDIRTVT